MKIGRLGLYCVVRSVRVWDAGYKQDQWGSRYWWIDACRWRLCAILSGRQEKRA